MHRPDAVLWDLDGVLIDVEDLHRAALNRALEAYGERPLTTGQYRDLHVFSTAKKLSLLGIRGDRRIAILTEKNQRFADLAAADLTRWSAVAPTVQAFLPATAMAVVSNGSRKTVSALRAACPYADRFETWICGEDGPRKPDPYLYLLACARLGVHPGAAVAVEDSDHGVEAAASAGIEVVRVAGPHEVTIDFFRRRGIL